MQELALEQALQLASHDAQLVAPASLNVPFEQAVQEAELVVALNVFAAQLLQLRSLDAVPGVATY